MFPSKLQIYYIVRDWTLARYVCISYNMVANCCLLAVKASLTKETATTETAVTLVISPVTAVSCGYFSVCLPVRFAVGLFVC